MQTLRMLLLALVMVSLTTPWAQADVLLDEALVAAIVARDLAKTRTLLTQGANPNATTDDNKYGSAMCRAAQRGMAPFMEVLLAHGANANQWFENAPSYDKTPLACAVGSGNVEAFELLLEAGAQASIELRPMQNGHGGLSMVQNAVLSGRAELLWRLLELGVATARDIESIVYEYENHSPGPYADESGDRQRIITWIREQGVEFEPKM